MQQPQAAGPAPRAQRVQELIDALAASRQLYKDILACAGGFCWETDNQGRFTFVDGAGLVGHAPLDLLGRSAGEAFGLDPESARLFFQVDSPLEQADVWLTHGEGRLICLQISARPVVDGGGQWQGARGIGFDVTLEREQAEALADAHAELDRLARSDALTGLANRRAFMESVATRLRHCARTGRSGALLYIDLDHFKSVNDSLGHAAGDAALIALGAGLKQQLRAADIAARLGGDEFAVWLEEADAEGALRMAARLVALAPALRRAVGDPECRLGLSVGAAVSHRDETLRGLLARADAALYRAKHGGRGRPALAAAFGEEDDGDV
ncbi:MAG: hypothetical protein Tsb0016_01730 [Sphingomonadales bacterium]